MTKTDITFVVPPTRAYSQIVPFPFIYLAAFWNIYLGHIARHFNILVEIFKNRFFQRKKARFK